MRDNQEFIEISCTFVHHTDKAVLINDGDREVWIPKSQISVLEDWYDLEPGDPLTIEIPEWLAEDKELI